MLATINPTTGEYLEPTESLTSDAINNQIQSAADGFKSWSSRTIPTRGKLLTLVAEGLKAKRQSLAELMALEMGKPLKEGLAEVDKAAWCAEHYAESAANYLADEALDSDASHSYVTYQPLGTVLGILPWNAPLWLAFRFLAPALMAGNTCVMKHDPHVPGCAAGIAEVFTEAQAQLGIEETIMVNLTITTDAVSGVIQDPRIMAVSFTGSSGAGKFVAAQAAALLKPAVLELGGSDPLIVMDDANLDKAADIAVLSRIINAGQSCIAAKRILVHTAVYSAFIDKVHQRLSKLKLGNPLEESTDIGPLARDDLRQNLHRQVSATIAAGACCLLGGDLPSTPGFFYPPTLLVDVKPGMPVFCEETFGPVMAVTEVKDLDQALAYANDTEYGLGSSIWTASESNIQRAIAELQAGQVAVNGIVKTDPRLPSGGIKGSGYGRELGPQGIREFVNLKQVWRA